VIELDARALACPMPIIKLKKCLAQNIAQNTHILMQLTDKSGLKDIPAFCQQQGLGFELLEQAPVIVFKIWRVV